MQGAALAGQADRTAATGRQAAPGHGSLTPPETPCGHGSLTPPETPCGGASGTGAPAGAPCAVPTPGSPDTVRRPEAPPAARPPGAPAPGAGPSAPAEPTRPSPRRVRLVLAALTLALLLAALDQTIVATALPRIVGELHGLASMPWAVTSYLLTSTAALPVYGRFGDLYGRKPVFAFAIAVFVLGSALAGWSHTMAELVVFRGLQGIGGGGLLIGVQAIIADIVPPRGRGRAMGLISAAFGLASVAGPLLGGYVTDRASWRWCFYLNVPFGLLTLAVVLAVLDLPRPAGRPRPDVLGALTLGGASTCLVLLASWGGTRYPWRSHAIAGLGAGALGAALLFLLAERFAAEPMIPLRLLRDRNFAVTAAVGAAVGVGLFASGAYLPTFLQMADGASATESGLLTLPLMGGIVLGSVVCGRLTGRTGRYRRYAVAGCALAAAGLWLLSHVAADTPRPVYSGWMAVLGSGLGLVLPVAVLAVQNAAAPADVGAATAANNYFRQIGGAVGAAVFGTLLARRLAARLSGRLPHPIHLPAPDSVTPQFLRALPAPVRQVYAHAYATAMPRIFLYLVPVLAVGALTAFLLKETPLVTSSDAQRDSFGSGATIPAARSAGGAGVPLCGTVQHSDGTTVARAALTLIDASGRQVGRGATGEDGRYALSTPGGGAYVLIAAAGGHQPQAVSVTVGERPVELDVVLGGAGRLAGTVLTADGTPVPEAVVTLTDARGEVVAGTRSGRDGGYALTDLVAGEYTLAASAPAYRPAALPVSVQAARETRQDVELAGGAVLRGAVRAPGGRPVEDARVTLLDAAGNVVDSATTGADGLFRFVDLAAGSYTVVAAGYPPVATVLQLAGGGRTERDLQLGHR